MLVRYQGRRKPYTERGISRVPCRRCGAPSKQQWQVGANGSRWLGVCAACDLELNRMTLAFFRLPNQAVLMAAYERALTEG